jgi:hypothetical protein
LETATQYDPPGHNAHVLEPSLLENVPAPQGLHAVEFVTDKYPAKHIVALEVEGQLYPAGQSMHTDEAVYEYVPLLHSVFIPPLHELPASQVEQLVAASSE